MPDHAALLDDGLAALAVPVSVETRQRLLSFVTLLARWNRVHNLTAVRRVDDMIVRHLLDSAVLLPWLQRCLPARLPARLPVQLPDRFPDRLPAPAANEMAPSSEPMSSRPAPLILDIGTGAGVPVLPLALLLPECRFLSVEANGKKCRFQRQALIELAITNVEVHEGRIESLACEADVVMARAFTAPERFLALAAERCRQPGHAFVLLGHSERLPDPVPAPWALCRLERLRVPGLAAARHLAICRLV